MKKIDTKLNRQNVALDIIHEVHLRKLNTLEAAGKLNIKTSQVARLSVYNTEDFTDSELLELLNTAKNLPK